MKRLFLWLFIILSISSCTVPLTKEIFDLSSKSHPQLGKLQALKVSEKDGVKYFSDGRLENRDGILILYLKGSQYEMGYQQGALLKDIIRDNVNKNPQFVRQNMEVIENLLKRLPYELLEELEGMAAGAGVDLKYLFATDILQYSRDLKTGCSNAIMFGNSTKGGKLFHIRTLDYHKEIKIFKNQVVCFYNPQKGIPFMGIITPGSVIVSSGMNKQLVSVGHNSNETNPLKTGVFDFYLFRYIAQFANNIDEASEIVMRASPSEHRHLIAVADAKNRTAKVFEMISKTERIFREPYKDYILAISYLIKDKSGKIPEDSMSRFKYYERLIEQNYGKIDESTCIDLVRGYCNFRKGKASPSYNIHSVIFNPVEGKIFVFLGPPFPACENKFHVFNIKKEFEE